MKTKLIAVIIGVAALLAMNTKAQTNTIPQASLSSGLQQIYDSVAGATNYGFVTGYARSTTGNRNVGFADIAYNFNNSVGLIAGYDYLWTSKQSGIPSQANLVKGGLNLQADLYPLKQIGLPNFKITPFGFALVASGNGQVSEIIGGGAKTTLATWKGINVNVGVLYENRTGAGYWDGRYVGGFAALSKGF